MNKKIEKYAKRFVRHIFRTYKNKLAVIMMLAIGFVAAKISGDATFLIIATVIFGPFFFVRENCFK